MPSNNWTVKTKPRKKPTTTMTRMMTISMMRMKKTRTKMTERMTTYLDVHSDNTPYHLIINSYGWRKIKTPSPKVIRVPTKRVRVGITDVKTKFYIEKPSICAAARFLGLKTKYLDTCIDNRRLKSL